MNHLNQPDTTIKNSKNDTTNSSNSRLTDKFNDLTKYLLQLDVGELSSLISKESTEDVKDNSTDNIPTDSDENFYSSSDYDHDGKRPISVSDKVLQKRRNKLGYSSIRNNRIGLLNNRGNTEQLDSDQTSMDDSFLSDITNKTIEINLPSLTNNGSGNSNNSYPMYQLLDMKKASMGFNLLNLSINSEIVLNNIHLFAKLFSSSISTLISATKLDDDNDNDDDAHNNNDTNSLLDRDIITGIMDELDDDIKFKILQLYLADSDLITNFKNNQRNSQNEIRILSNSNKAKKTDNKAQIQVEKKRRNSVLLQGNESISDQLSSNSVDSLVLKTVDLSVSLFISIVVQYMTIITPILSFFYKELMNLNDQFHIVEGILKLGLSIVIIILMKVLDVLQTKGNSHRHSHNNNNKNSLLIP